MALNASDYTQHLKALLPIGSAWNKEDGSTLTLLLQAIAEELARIDWRVDDLLNESDPRITRELLPDWERVVGLHGGCFEILGTDDQRRTALVNKLTAIGGQSQQFYIDFAAALGWDITINEFVPFRAGQTVGKKAYGDAYAYVWEIQPRDITPFVAGDVVGSQLVAIPKNWEPNHFTAGNGAGERLKNLGFAYLRCKILEIIPANTFVLWWSQPTTAGKFAAGISRAGDPLFGCLQRPKEFFRAGDEVGQLLAIY